MGISPDAPLFEDFDYTSSRGRPSSTRTCSTSSGRACMTGPSAASHKDFEIYEQNCQVIDAVPEDAEFHVANDLIMSSRNFGAKEFKKVLGKEFDPKQAMQILWTSLPRLQKRSNQDAAPEVRAVFQRCSGCVYHQSAKASSSVRPLSRLWPHRQAGRHRCERTEHTAQFHLPLLRRPQHQRQV